MCKLLSQDQWYFPACVCYNNCGLLDILHDKRPMVSCDSHIQGFTSVTVIHGLNEEVQYGPL